MGSQEVSVFFFLFFFGIGEIKLIFCANGREKCESNVFIFVKIWLLLGAQTFSSRVTEKLGLRALGTDGQGWWKHMYRGYPLTVFLLQKIRGMSLFES